MAQHETILGAALPHQQMILSQYGPYAVLGMLCVDYYSSYQTLSLFGMSWYFVFVLVWHVPGMQYNSCNYEVSPRKMQKKSVGNFSVAD